MVIEIENLVKRYHDLIALDHFNLQVKEGEIFGLLGVNGAGKTTTFRMIMGLLEPTKGEITLNGKPIDYNVTDTIGFLTEERSLLTKLTVKEQALFYGALKSMTEDQILKRLDELLERFEIMDYKDKKIKELSKGNQQKVQFIMAILNDPKLLILDEPFSGLDPFNVELFKREIIDMSKRGSMIIFSSHRMEHVELFCKKIVIILRGTPVLEGYLSDIKRDYRKKNILIKGEITKKELMKIKGVYDVIEKPEEFEVKIDSLEVAQDVFKVVSKHKNITKFSVEEPSLNEIFVAKVGEAYEK